MMKLKKLSETTELKYEKNHPFDATKHFHI